MLHRPPVTGGGYECTNRAPAEHAAADDGRAGGHLLSGPVYNQHMPLGRHFCMHQYNELDAAEWRL